MDEFKVMEFSRINNPRSYYFSLLRGRQEILDHIFGDITEKYFYSHPYNEFPADLNIKEYREFVAIQKDQVKRLTGAEIESILSVLRILLPKSVIYHAEYLDTMPLTSLFFNGEGTIIWTSSGDY